MPPGFVGRRTDMSLIAASKRRNISKAGIALLLKYFLCEGLTGIVAAARHLLFRIDPRDNQRLPVVIRPVYS